MIRRGKRLLESMGATETYCNKQPPNMQFYQLEKELPALKDSIKKHIASKGEWSDVSNELLQDWYDNYDEFKRNQEYYKEQRRKDVVDLNKVYSQVSDTNKKIAKWVDDIKYLIKYGMTKADHEREIDDLKKMFRDYFNGVLDTSKYR